MQGAIINEENNSNYGNIIALEGVGTFELLTISSVVGNVITIPTTKNYKVDGSVQIIKVPDYSAMDTTKVSDVLTGKEWNGSKGGVLALKADKLFLDSNIVMTGKGFRSFQNDPLADYLNQYVRKGLGGVKGEGIAKINTNIGDRGKGKQATGGGGGENEESGGGGGGNYGIGGHGSNIFNQTSESSGSGKGGQLKYNCSTPSYHPLMMGGAGGSGYASSGRITIGGFGGGIIMIFANEIDGSGGGEILSQGGLAKVITEGTDAAAGGGAGGSVYTTATNFSNLNINISGSDANDATPASAQVLHTHGGAGGGGGGALFLKASSLPSGITLTADGGKKSSLGQQNATDGTDGGLVNINQNDTVPFSILPNQKYVVPIDNIKDNTSFYTIKTSINAPTITSGNIISQSPNGNFTILSGGRIATTQASNLAIGSYTLDLTLTDSRGVTSCSSKIILQIAKDSDSDGIVNFDDMDDDNDGIPDVIESPNCFYTYSEAIKIQSVTSELTPSSSDSLSFSHDNDLRTETKLNAGQNWEGKTIYEITPPTPLKLKQLDVILGTTSFSSNSSSSFRLEGLIDANWVQLSNIIIHQSTANFSLINTLDSLTTHSKFRIVGVAGSSDSAGVFEFNLVPKDFQSFEHPKATCDEDFDMDGLYNHLDLDSDGDGCYDFYESGAHNYNDSLVTQSSSYSSVGTNGFANYLETNADSDTINYTYQPYAISKSINTCSDTDQDGIKDFVDRDDDNDGILDSIDCGFNTNSKTFNLTPLADNWMFLGNANATTINGDSVIGITQEVANQVGAAWVKEQIDLSLPFEFEFNPFLGSKDGADGLAFVLQTQGLNAVSNFGSSLGYSTLTPAYLAIEMDINSNGTNFGDFDNNNHTTIHTGSQTNIIGNYACLLPNCASVEDNKFHKAKVLWNPSTQLLQFYFDDLLRQSVNINLIDSVFQGQNSVYLGITGATGGVTNTSGFQPIKLTNQSSQTCLDTDNDGIVNSLDLDADGDGIPDNIEAQTAKDYLKPSDTIGTDGVYSNYSGFTPIDTDNDSIPDFLDRDSDNAQTSDSLEAGVILTYGDKDQDGLDDYIDTDNTRFGPANAGITNVLTAYPSNLRGVDWRTNCHASSDTTKCDMYRGAVFLDNGIGGGTYKDNIQNGTENGKNLPDSLFANVIHNDTIVSSSYVNNHGFYLIPELADGTYTVVLTNSDTATSSTLPDFYSNSSSNGTYSITVSSKSVTSPTNIPKLGIHTCEFGIISRGQYAIENYPNVNQHPNGVHFNAIGPPNDNGANLFGHHDPNLIFLVLKYDKEFTGGQELTITSKYNNNDSRKDGFRVQFGVDSLNWTPLSELLNDRKEFEFSDEKYVIPKSLTGQYKWIRMAANSLNTITFVDAVGVFEFECNRCPAGSDAPILSSGNNIINACPASSVNLNDITAKNMPRNTVITWHTSAQATDNNRVSNTKHAYPGVYYAAFYSADSSCYSGLDGVATTRLEISGDTDCDGVPNDIDIDDDNDGILDVLERVTCNLDTLKNETSSTMICDTERSTDKFIHWDAPEDGDTILTGKFIMGPNDTVDVKLHLELGINYNGLTHHGFEQHLFFCPHSPHKTRYTPIFSQRGKYRFEFSKAIYMPRMHIASLGADAGGSSHTRVTLTFKDNIKEIKDFYSTLLTIPSAKTTKTDGNGGTGTIQFTDGYLKEIEFESDIEEHWWGMTISTSEAKQCDNYDLDTDGDGIPNRLDLDSDGDGCYDKYEAGIIGATTNGAFSDSLTIRIGQRQEVGANGFANNLETVLDNGIYKGSYTYNKATDSIGTCPVPTPRLSCVDPINDRVIIKNYGSFSVDISNYRLCSRTAYTTNGIAADMTVESGSLVINQGDSVILTGFSLNDTIADLALYSSSGAFTDSSALIDFTQWGAAGIGRENIAVSKGIWEAGTYIKDATPFYYTGNGKENGVHFWDGNDFPIAQNDINTTLKNIAVTGNVSLNDYDLEGGVLKVVTTPINPTNGTVMINDLGQYTFTPDSGFIGEASFEYKICEQANPTLCANAKVIIDVIDEINPQINNKVIGIPDNYITENDTTLRSNLLNNDSDPDGDSIAIATTPVTTVSNGTLTINSDGSFVYMPNNNFVGKDSFSYRVCDNGSPITCDTVSVSILVLASNRQNDLYATDDAFVIVQKSFKIGNVTLNDNDPEGDDLTVDSMPLSNVTNGFLALNADGSFVYRPNSNFIGNDQFTYRVCDNGNPIACDSATVYITVLEKQEPPFVLPGVLTILRDSSGSTCLNIFEINDDTMHTATQCAMPSPSGTTNLSVNNGKVCLDYTPSSGFTGQDSVCIIVCDATNLCHTTGVSITVVAPLDTSSTPSAPVVIPSTIITTKDSTATTSMPILDPNIGDTFTASLCTGSPSNGSATPSVINNTLSLNYTPNSGFIGNDKVCIIVCDQTSLCDTVNVDVKVAPTPITPDTMQPPILVFPSIITKEDVTTTYCGLVADPNSLDTHQVVICQTPSRGTASASINNNTDKVCITYTPTPGYNGTDSICIRVCDQTGLCDTVKVGISVIPVNDPPIAKNDVNVTVKNTTISGKVNTNDYDPEGDVLKYTTTAINLANGTVIIDSLGNYTFTPATNFIGTASFEYETCDQTVPKLCDTAKVTIQVIEVITPNTNSQIIGLPDNFTMENDAILTSNLISNDNDPDGDSILINTTPVQTPNEGSLTINMDGSFSYDPNNNFIGKDSFYYQICDNGSPITCDTVEVTITVLAPNNKNDLYATDDATIGKEDSTQTGNVLTNDYDPEGHSLTVNTSPLTNVSNGSLTLNGNGSFVYQPNMDFSGSDEFKYLVCDNGSPQACDSATVYITVLERQIPPSVLPSVITMFKDSTAYTCTNIFDPNKHSVFNVRSCSNSPQNGGVSLFLEKSKACLLYTPSLGYTGSDNICIIVCDQTGLCDTTNILVTVIEPLDSSSVPTKPVVIPSPIITPMDSTANTCMPILDPNIGDTFTATICNGSPANGSATPSIKANSLCLEYTPNSGFVGDDPICVSVCDQTGLCDTVNVRVKVVATPIHPDSMLPPILVIPPIITPEDSMITTCGIVVDINPNDTHQVMVCKEPDNGSMTTSINNQTHQVCINYQPHSNFYGKDSICIKVCDQTGLCDSVTFVATVLPINDPPIASNDVNITTKNNAVNGSVSTNDSDPDGDRLTVNTSPINPVNGTVSIDTFGNYTFTPNTEFIGQATFRYQICDQADSKLCDTAKVTIEVIDNSMPNNSNNKVIGVADNYIMENDTTLRSNLLSNDIDPDGDSIFMNTTPIQSANSGTLTLNSDGSFIYDPINNFIGKDSFYYQVCDNGTPMSCDTVEVTIIVLTPDNKNSIYAIDDASIALQDIAQNGNVLTNDYDPEGHSLTVNTTPLSNVKNGSLTLNADGSFVYQPTADFFGADQFKYVVCDNGSPQACDSATVYLTILERQFPPFVLTNVLTIFKDSTTTTCLTIFDKNKVANFNANLCTASPQSGSASLNLNSNKLCVTYTPNSGFVGADNICVIVCDQTGLCDTANIPVTVIAPLDSSSIPTKPVIIPSPIITPKDSTASTCMPILDPNKGDTFTASICNGSPANGTATPSIVGNTLCLEYTPNTGFIGDDPICVSVCDQTGLCDTVNVRVKVVNIPIHPDSMLPPILIIPPIITPEDSMITTCGVVIDINPKDSHQVMVCKQPTNGTITTSLNNQTNQVCIDYTPKPNFNGKDSICIKICDQTGLCDSLIVSITTISVNDAPIASNDVNITTKNNAATGLVSSNDSDPDGDRLTVNATPINPVNGTVTLDTFGNYTFNPNHNFIGEASFHYQICDQADPNLCDTAKVIIEVIDHIVPHNTNNKVIGVADNYIMENDTTLRSNLLSNDIDPDGDSIFINTTPIQTANSGALTIFMDGSFIYTPISNFIGKVQFFYQVCDDGSPISCDTVEVNIIVLSPDEKNSVYATDDASIGKQDSTQTGNVLTNDYDPEGNSLTVNTTPLSNVANGSLTLNADGSFIYQPSTNFSGNDQFKYMVCDNGSPQACDSATVYLTIIEKQLPPFILPSVLTILKDSIGTTCLTVFDHNKVANFDTRLCANSPQSGSVSLALNDSKVCVTYTPNTGFVGSDNICVIVCDQTGLCDTANIPVTIIEPLDSSSIPTKPVIIPSPILTAMDSTANACMPILDPNKGDTFTASICNGSPANGTATPTIKGNILCLEYTPNTGFVGDDPICVVVCDQTGLCDTANIRVKVVSTPIHPDSMLPPILIIPPIITSEDSMITTCGVVIDINPNDTHQIMVCKHPDNGSITTSLNNETNQVCINYQPNQNFNGKDNMCIKICDKTGLCDSLTLAVTVISVNDPPIAMVDNLTIEEDMPVVIDVQKNDVEIDNDPLTTSLLGNSTRGVIPLILNGDSLSYIPPRDYFGQDTITYQVCDNRDPMLCDTSNVIINITPVNDAPIALNDINITELGTVVSGNVLNNDEDIEMDNLFVTNSPFNVKNGTVQIVANGNYTFTPNPGFSGEASFKYKVCDTGSPSLCDTASVFIEIIDNSNTQNNKVIGLEDNFITKSNKPINANLLSNDIDPDGDSLVLTTSPIEPIAHGQLTLFANGNFNYLPDSNYVGSDGFKYEVCDDGSPKSCDTVLVQIEVIADNRQNTTFATDDIGFGLESQPITGNVLDNDNDPEGDNQTVISPAVTSPQNGTLTIDANGTYQYQPNFGFTGNDQFLYSVCDDGSPSVCDTATVRLTVFVNNLLAINDINQTLHELSVEGQVFTNDMDASVIPKVIKFPTNGKVNLALDGSYLYSPNAKFNGIDLFEYQVCYKIAPTVCDTAQVSIQVLSSLIEFGNKLTAQADNIIMDINQQLDGCLICNDSDPEENPFSININPVRSTNHGNLQIHPDGHFTYIPESGFIGEDFFEYQICHNAAPSTCATAKVTIKVMPDDKKNDTYSTDDAFMGIANKSISGNLLLNDNDPEKDKQHIALLPPNSSASLVTNTTNGVLSLQEDGNFSYTPKRNFIGNDQFIYEVCDNNTDQACSRSTVYFTVLPFNYQPLITDPCTCLNNESKLGDGQFSEKISILSVKPNEKWTLISNKGLYSTSSSAPPATPTLIPIGTVAVADGKLNNYFHYVLNAIHIDAIGYQSKFTNGKDTIEIKNTCFYDQSCRLNNQKDTCVQNFVMGTNGIPKENSLKCCDSKASFVDDGSTDGLYKDNTPRDDQFTICPQNQWQALKFNFKEFGLAPGDSLIVYDGKSIFNNRIGTFGGEGVSKTGGWVAASCNPSINQSGCLTFQLVTNGDNIKSIGWSGSFVCSEREITLTPPNNLVSTLNCEQTYSNFSIKPATIKAACGTVQDSQIVRVFNYKGDLCLDTCLTDNQTITKEFALGSYLVEYKLKSDTIKTTRATLTVQGPSLACNDIINIPLGSACSVTLTPDDLLESSCDTITDTVYYFITLKGVDKNGKEITIASGGGKGGKYPTISKDAIQACSGILTATIEKRYYHGLNLSICNNGPYTENCSVEVNLKDQTPPVFSNVTANDTFKICSFDLSEATFASLKPDATDNCSKARVSFVSATPLNQADDVCDTTKVNVTWKATDDCDNSITQTQLIVFIRPNAADIVKAPDVILSCESDKEYALNNLNKSALPGLKIGKIKNGILVPTDTLALSETEYTCGYILQKRIVEFPGDCGIKIFQYWDLLDWCESNTGLIPVDTQLVEFKDTLAPKFVLDSLPSRVVALEHDACTFDIFKLEKPLATDNCSQPIAYINRVYRIENGKDIEMPQHQLNFLDCDSFRIRWIAQDLCHEQLVNDTITQIIIIQDQTKPSAICHDQIRISLSKNDVFLHYKEFDAGSHDACGIDKYEISRDKINWDSIVSFNCEDIHSEIDVFLRVTDNKGNQSTCWAKVVVEDKIAPICTELPDAIGYCDDTHLGMDLNPTDLNQNGIMDDKEWVDLTPNQMALFNENYGSPNCTDNVPCNQIIIEQQYQFLEYDCGKGKIKRRYRATDWDGEGLTSNWFVQHINIESKEDWSITLPADWIGYCGDNIPSSEAIIQNGKCDLFAYEVDEKTFTSAEGACLKVVRTFTLTNLCNYQTGTNPLNIPRIENQYGTVLNDRVITSKDFSKTGRFIYVQVLKLKDETAPVISFEPVDDCISDNNCKETKRFSIKATDCNELATSQLSYNWILYTNATQIASGQGASFEALVIANQVYEVEWTVADNCGNKGSQKKAYTFKDCKKPSPYCIDGIAVDLMEQSAEVQIWASDITQGGNDNCTPKDKLDYRIWHASLGEAPSHFDQVQQLPKAITFNCDMLGYQSVSLYLIDEAGNWDYCITQVNIQDNTKACENKQDSALARVSGTIRDWLNQTIPNVQIDASNSINTLTQSDGYYQLSLDKNKDYLIKPNKNIEPLNGVSTFDLVLISKHILGLQTFDSPYQYIAADANKSGDITVFDMVQIRRLILNIDTEFKYNESWRFVDAEFAFVSPNPLEENFKESIEIKQLQSDKTIDFVAVKIGDVNGNATVSNLIVTPDRSSKQPLKISTFDKTLKAGQNYNITFSTKQLSQIQGYQFTLGFKGIDNVQVTPLAIGLEHFGLHATDKGFITSSWNYTPSKINNVPDLHVQTALFTLKFTAQQDGKLSELIQLLDRPTTIEAYDRQDNRLDIELNFEQNPLENEFELFQNQPNPFNEKTTIGFFLPGNSEIQLILRDETGRILKTIKEERKAGFNTILIHQQEITNGFIYYQLHSKYGVKAKKMLQVK
jgi:hypothetical protein